MLRWIDRLLGKPFDTLPPVLEIGDSTYYQEFLGLPLNASFSHSDLEDACRRAMQKYPGAASAEQIAVMYDSIVEENISAHAKIGWWLHLGVGAVREHSPLFL